MKMPFRSRVPDRPGNEEGWVAELREQIAEGQYFLAFDSYREAIATYPDSLPLSLLGVLALLRGGAVEEALRLLDPLEGRLATRTIRSRRLVQAIQAVVAGKTEAADALLAEIRQGVRGDLGQLDDQETLRLAVQLHTEIWARVGGETILAHAYDLADEAFALSGRADDGLAAASLAALRGEGEQARKRAAEVAALCQGGEDMDRERLLILGQAAILLGDAGLSEDAFRRAVTLHPRHYPSIVRILRHLETLAQAGYAIPAPVRSLLRPPRTVIFGGQSLDHPGMTEPCFPPEIEADLASVIAQRLDDLDAEVGYCSAGAGSDLLFIEAMLNRGAEVHISLPFAVEDFVAHRVAYAGPRWERRFRNALRLATSVSFATEERYLGHDVLFRFNNYLIEGMAQLQGEFHLSEPHLMVTLDYLAESGAGTVADFMDAWPDITRLHVIDLEELREARASAPPSAPALFQPSVRPPPKPQALEPERVIRTMLFADIVGYSKLSEADLPALWRGLEGVRAKMEGRHKPLRLLESWGDALYAVMDSSQDMLDYAFALLEAIEAMEPGESGLSRRIQLRVGLHAGPVFEGVHPLSGRTIVYGSHVSRAARIEPISLPGHIYASQQFVGMLKSEENSARHFADSTGRSYARRFTCEYLGSLSLAKNYGRQPVYHIRKRDDAPPSGRAPS
ncbi:adenylate/guanylate cyclase domain-containing protein [Telmatospirillum sp. J64-1]|uniref:adenylate/guanylate cyclase domain-containing protein n=1 Tax=Telmatospirillum sp. J64-1 TaxID=2502183 RepID=UPI00163DC83A|nr:adenylate/guanylate cyclase domain-containing protein [Telmatospirillum sp. J64-1]